MPNSNKARIWSPVFIGRRLGADLRMDTKRHVFEKRLDSMLINWLTTLNLVINKIGGTVWSSYGSM